MVYAGNVILPINDKHRIRGERSQWVIEERKRRQHNPSDSGGATYTAWEAVGYCASLGDAVGTLTDLQLRTSGAKTIVEAQVESKRISAEMVAALSPTFHITPKEAAE